MDEVDFVAERANPEIQTGFLDSGFAQTRAPE
jgi:hypothetical protein